MKIRSMKRIMSRIKSERTTGNAGRPSATRLFSIQHSAFSIICAFFFPFILSAQTTAPTSRPTTAPTSQPSLVLEPVTDSATTKPAAVNLKYREGTFLIDQIGQLKHTKTGDPFFVFEADGKPIELGIMPNTYLAKMEDVLTTAGPNVRFRITAMATEYREKNYILIDRAEVVQ